MGFKKFFSAIANIFRKADTKLTQVEDILPDALEIAKVIAALTPTRSDEEIIALIETYAEGSIHLGDFVDKGDALRAVARIALQKRLRMNIRQSILNAAIDIAALEFNGD